MTIAREGSVILFENSAGQLAFQLRDNRPDVSYANHWGLFGGWQESGEAPEQTIRREMRAELGLQLELSKLRYLRRYVDGDIISHVFQYPVTDEFRAETLLEGQRLEFMSLSDLEHHNVVPRHKSIVAWYTAHKSVQARLEIP